MSALFGTQMAKVTVGTPPAPGFLNGSVRCFSEQVTLATQTTGDTITVARIPKGSVFLYGVLNASASLTSATIAIGSGTATGKYRAAATFQAVDTPTFFGVNAATGVALAADEDVFITIAAASLPAAGKLDVDMYYAFN